MRPLFEGHPGRARQTGIMPGGFEHVVIQSGLHGFHGNLLAASAGEHDNGAAWPTRLDRPEHGQAVGPTQLVIGDDQITNARFQRHREACRIDDLTDLGLGKIAPQLADGEGAIVGIVIHQQDVEPICHELFFRWLAR